MPSMWVAPSALEIMSSSSHGRSSSRRRSSRHRRPLGSACIEATRAATDARPDRSVRHAGAGASRSGKWRPDKRRSDRAAGYPPRHPRGCPRFVHCLLANPPTIHSVCPLSLHRPGVVGCIDCRRRGQGPDGADWFAPWWVRLKPMVDARLARHVQHPVGWRSGPVRQRAVCTQQPRLSAINPRALPHAELALWNAQPMSGDSRRAPGTVRCNEKEFAPWR